METERVELRPPYPHPAAYYAWDSQYIHLQHALPDLEEEHGEGWLAWCCLLLMAIGRLAEERRRGWERKRERDLDGIGWRRPKRGSWRLCR